MAPQGDTPDTDALLARSAAFMKLKKPSVPPLCTCCPGFPPCRTGKSLYKLPALRSVLGLRDALTDATKSIELGCTSAVA
jgi:hypothetical protein